MKKLFVLLLFTLIFLSVWAQVLPRPTTYVIDNENLFTSEQRSDLESLLSTYQKKTSIEMLVLTVSSYDGDIYTYSINTFRVWKVGKKNLNNGVLLVISKENRKWQCITGYGLEPLITDADCKSLGDAILPPSFRQGDYYGGTKEYLSSLQQKIGDEGFTMMVQYKKIQAKYHSEMMKVWFLRIFWSFIVIGFLIGLFFLIRYINRRNKAFQELKNQIDILDRNIENLKDELIKNLGALPHNIQEWYDSDIALLPDPASNSDINLDSLSQRQSLYDAMLEVKKLINTTNAEIRDILADVAHSQDYMKNKYDYCGDYLLKELQSIIPDTKGPDFTSIEFTDKRLKTLMGIRSVFEKKFKTFLNKTYKINAITSDFNDHEKKLATITKSYKEYLAGKDALAKMNIGEKDGLLTRLNFETETDQLTLDISASIKHLKNNEFDLADKAYASYLTRMAVITGAFTSVDSLISNADKSQKYITDNKDSIAKFSEKIDKKIDKAGVSSLRKESYSKITKKIEDYNKATQTDIILAASLLRELITEMSDLEITISSDIKYHISRSSPSYSRGGGYISTPNNNNNNDDDTTTYYSSPSPSYNDDSSSSSSSSSSDDSPSFGGDSGGGGAGGDW